MIEASPAPSPPCRRGCSSTPCSPCSTSPGRCATRRQGYVATEWFLLGAIQVLVLWAVLRPIEALAPAERWADRRATRVDVVYTLLHRLGVIPLAIFLLVSPLFDLGAQALRAFGFTPFNLDNRGRASPTCRW